MSKNPYGQPPPNNPYSPAPPPQQPYHRPPTMGPQVSALAIVSLVTGILSLPFSFCCGCFSIPLGLAAVICGAIAIPQCNSGKYTGKGMAIGGLCCGGAALLLVIALIVLQVFLEIGGGGNFQMPNF